MNVIFFIRCFKPTNLPRIQQNIRDVFRGSMHKYKIAILFDATHNNKQPFPYNFFNIDTSIFICTEKDEKDVYLTAFMDYVLEHYTPWGVKKCYVYVHDDDNLIMPEFLTVLDETTDEHAVVFKVKNRPELGNPDIEPGKAVGKIDWANYIVRLDFMKTHHIHHKMLDGHDSDGHFFNNLLTLGANIKYIDRVCGLYNALPKP